MKYAVHGMLEVLPEDADALVALMNALPNITSPNVWKNEYTVQYGIASNGDHVLVFSIRFYLLSDRDALTSVAISSPVWTKCVPGSWISWAHCDHDEAERTGCTLDGGVTR